jgi:hypothetical protein
MCLPSHHRMRDTDPVSHISWYLEYRTVEKVQKSNNPECYNPSSELWNLPSIRIINNNTITVYLWDNIMSFAFREKTEMTGSPSQLNLRWSYPCNRPWRSIGLWNFELPYFLESAHRWRWGCQPYAPAALDPQEDSWYSFLLEAESIPGP